MLQKIATLVFLVFLVSGSVNGQQSSPVTKEKEKASIAAMPLINYSRTQGILLGALVSKYFDLNKTDTISPSSNAGIFGVYTEQKSYAAFAYSQLYFSKDIWRITAALGALDINFQFFLQEPVASTGNFYDYTSEATLALLQVQRNVFKRVYFGPTASYIKSTTTFEIPNASGADSVSKSHLNNIGYIITNDTRDHVQYPSVGMFANFKNQFYRDWVASDFNFERYLLTYNQFFKLKKSDRHVLAIRATVNVAAGDVPFEGQTVVGGDDIRGYSQGQYRDDQVYTLQSEYRWNFYKRWGMVAFAGVASAVSKFSDISDTVLPGAGAGIRFKMLPAEKINIGIDGAVGKGDYSITFRIGESFGR
ncbi:BamA/TamA family outer membrane protein [Flavihumibacter sp. R14]|nr:BamA/TamA family outer membrane protein [Flavihumibacter soli]